MCRLMQRAIHKAKLPFWYTEGFNPHVFLTINMPISLGYTGLRESLDVKILDDDMPFSEVISKLNSGLPEDIQVFEITEMILKPGAIAFSQYEITLDKTDALVDATKKLISQPSIIVSKKTKKGFKDIDIKADFENMDMSENENQIVFKAILKSSNQGSINPRLFFDVLSEQYGEKLYPQIARINCFDENMKVFY